MTVPGTPRPGTPALSMMTPAQAADRLGWRRVLAFGAHPDDLDFGTAATMAALSGAGVHIVYCVMTDGEAGGFDDSTRPSIVEDRHREQREAAAHLGVADLVYLGERDGYLEPNHRVQAHVVRLMRQQRPDAVFSMHPERAWERLQAAHPDHLACGEAVVRAAYPAVENPFAYPELRAEGLEAFHLRWLVLFGGPRVHTNLVLDVTGHEQDKLTALRHHLSQHPDVPRMESFVLGAMAANHDEARAILGPAGEPGPGAVGEPGRGAGGAETAQRGEQAPRYGEAFHLVEVNSEETISGF